MPNRLGPGSIWTRREAHFRRIVLGKTPEVCVETMQAVTGVVLEADSQPEAFEAFEGVAAEERTRIAETSEGETVDTFEQLCEAADAALDLLEEGLEAATGCRSFLGNIAGGSELQA